MSKTSANPKVNSAFGNFCSLSQKRFSNKRERIPNKTKQINIGVNNIKKYTIPIHRLNINSTNSTGSENNENLNSRSLNCNDDIIKNNKNVKEVNKKLDDAIENMKNIEDSYEEENFFNFMRFDLKRKIEKKNIEWEYKWYSIWDPELSE